MKEEWLNRIAITWNNRTYLRHVRNILDLYSTATEAVARHPELITQAALEFAQKEPDINMATAQDETITSASSASLRLLMLPIIIRC